MTHVHASAAPVEPRTTRNERRTRVVLALTVVTMIAELAVGVWTGSLALQADGWHMATHAGALGLASFGYWFARTRAEDRELVFGTGKVNALSGFASAIALGVVAVFMTIEAVERLLSPEHVEFRSALPVATLGLFVNLASLFLLGGDQPHEEQAALAEHGHGHAHGGHGHAHGHGHGAADHNLRGVYLHVLADSITSVLAIAALVVGAWLDIVWLDAVTALVAALLIVIWARSLLRETARPLLDARAPEGEITKIEEAVRALEGVTEVSVCMWDLGSSRRALAVDLTSTRRLGPREVRAAIPELQRFVHTAIEIHVADPSVETPVDHASPTT